MTNEETNALMTALSHLVDFFNEEAAVATSAPAPPRTGQGVIGMRPCDGVPQSAWANRGISLNCMTPARPPLH